MRNNFLLCGLTLLALVGTAQAAIVVNNWSSGTLNAVIPDGSPVGYATSQTFGGLGSSVINEVDVVLNISGGYNGDLYGYLVLQSTDGSTTTSILLNRVGRTDALGFGDAGSGFSVTLVGYSGTPPAYANIHDKVGTPGQATTGNYLADGRAIDPNGNFSGANVTAGLNILDGKNPNGIWTLFLADMSGGDTSTLVSWGLDVSVVPEPITWALMIFCGLIASIKLASMRKAAKPV